MTAADDRYCYCPICGARGMFAGQSPHGDHNPCPLAVAESEARIAANAQAPRDELVMIQCIGFGDGMWHAGRIRTSQ